MPPGTSIEDGLAIDEAVATALWNNARFQVALASLGIARADLVEAGLLKNPVLSLLFPWGPKQLEFTATWSDRRAVAASETNRRCEVQCGSRRSQLVATGLNLAADVRLAFLDAVVAERRLFWRRNRRRSARAPQHSLRAGFARATSASSKPACRARTRRGSKPPDCSA